MDDKGPIEREALTEEQQALGDGSDKIPSAIRLLISCNCLAGRLYFAARKMVGSIARIIIAGVSH